MTTPATPATPITLAPKGAPRSALDRVRKASQKLVYECPHFFAALARATWVEDPAIATFGVTSKFQIRFNPAFALALPAAHLIGVIAHECMHPLLDHWERGLALGVYTADGKGDPQLRKCWAYAIDMVINSALREDGLQLPQGALYPPREYSGPLRAEALYQWLRDQKDESSEEDQGESGDESGEEDSEGNESGATENPADPSGAPVGQGCLPIQDPSDESGAQGTQGDGSGPAPMSREMREIGEQVRAAIMGRDRSPDGHSAMAGLLERVPSRVDWRSILTGAVSQCARTTRRDFESYSRRNRRSPVNGIQWPGWKGLDPRIAVVIDCSSSMDREWIAKIVGHCERLTGQYPGSKVFLVTHTSGVCWAGWLRAGGDLKALYDATAYGGGTQAGPAYERVRAENARFDFLVHFTDTEIESPWPEPPARKCVIGAFGSGAFAPSVAPPAGARILACKEE